MRAFLLGVFIQLEKVSGQEVTKFKPELANRRSAEADSIIAYAKRVKDWSMLERAIEQKLDDQSAFVTWWTENVTARLQSGSKLCADQRTTLTLEKAEELTGIKHQQVSKWRQRLKDRVAYRKMLFGVAYTKAMAEKSNIIASKWMGDPDSYTPAKYIDAARLVMGSVDLDPASNATAQETVVADRWYGIEQDGLKQQWQGNVFLNPPYSHPEVAHFVEKLCDEYSNGNIRQAILLTNNNTDTKWWHLAASVSTAVCFTLGRINFYKSDGSITQPTNGQTFFYFGQNTTEFQQTFGGYGLILVKPDDN